ncbi:MAG: histidine kinase [Bacteroidales bacterium]|nr:histidine kinase [Bacteroidales bacterium]
MKKSSILLIHLAFWAVSVIIPSVLVLTYKSQITQGMIIFQIITQLYYAIVFYFIYLFIVPATLGSSRGFVRTFIIFGASVLFLWFMKIGKTVIADQRFNLGLDQYNVYSTTHYISDLINIIIYTLFALFLKISISWYNERKRTAEMTIQEHRMELEFLKAQLNPHFFFNTLNNIYSLVYKKSDEAPAALMKLSDIMRYMLYESKAEKVPLDKELEHLGNYLELEKLRLKDPEFISWSVDGDTSMHQVPPMLLLSFVENAFKHGKKRVSNPGIVIKVTATEKRLRFLVSNYTLDNSPETDKEAMGIGLQNNQRRLELLYPGCYDLKISRNREKYTVTLELFCNPPK